VLRPGANGTFDFVYTDVDAVCPHARPECVPPPAEHEGSNVNLLGAKASTVTLSPNSNQVVYEAEDDVATGGHKILIVPVAETGEASPPPETPGTRPSAGASAEPSPPRGSAEPTPIATPQGQIEIASGVTIVGDVGYSPDGKWLAFSAAPKDGSTGPDLYIYAVGGSAVAAPVTTDHQTYFSAWLGGSVLASRIAVVGDGSQSPGNPKSSDAPGPSGQGSNGQGNGKPLEGRASSFLFDPATGATADLGQPGIWMPVVDPKNRFVAYWSGSLRSRDGVAWQLGEGQLVLDRWLAEGAPADATAAASAASTSPPGPGPAGDPAPIVTSHVEDFVAKFDPDGIRLAVWVSENAKATDGRLHLVVIDPSTGAIGKDEPLPGEPALRRFSIGENRLAWVSPSGQDGKESSLQVLGWSGDTFGQIESEPSADVLILR